jgi:nucleoid-associated protein YgaU
MSVLLTPGLAGAAAPDTGSHHPVSAAAPAWPTDDALRAPRWPTVSRHRATHPRTAPKPPAAPTSPQLPAHVTVTPGDSLWRIAAAHLPGHPTAHRVAAAWPRWYAANRRVIGADPDLIQPGQVLHPPTQGSRS